jgi:UPF0755 protein
MKKNLKTGLIIILAACTGAGIWGYYAAFMPNVINDNGGWLYIRTGSNYADLFEDIKNNKMLKDEFTFDMLAGIMKLKSKIKPGRYQIKKGMSNRELITLLRSGRQTPLRFTFNNLRTVYDLAGVMGRTFEADSLSILKEIFKKELLDTLKLDSLSIATIFIPNTYEMYWNERATSIIKRMLREHKAFWNEERLAKAKALNLTPAEVSILASIVEQETRMNDEKPLIAGVYLNRLRKGWKLEADPTLVFASGNFGIRRVLNVHKEIDSPFNTYKYTGLPPGPICIPSIASIDAVLNFKEHDYLFFCAREDMSGYHSFAKTYEEHLRNAHKFQRELNSRGIKQ